jgi:hypothetical protein
MLTKIENVETESNRALHIVNFKLTKYYLRAFIGLYVNSEEIIVMGKLESMNLKHLFFGSKDDKKIVFKFFNFSEHSLSKKTI